MKRDIGHRQPETPDVVFAFHLGIGLSWPPLAKVDAAGEFDTARAMAPLRACSGEPRPAGSAARAAGDRGYDFALIGCAEHYHMPTDTPERLVPRRVQQTGRCVTDLARA